MPRTPAYAYFTQQFLTIRNDRKWKLALLAYDKIAIPISNESTYFSVSNQEQRIVASMQGRELPSPFDSTEDDRVDVTSLTMKQVCNGDQRLVDRLKPYLTPIRSCDIPLLLGLLRVIDSMQFTGLPPVLHGEITRFVDSALPHHDYNNFPNTNLTCVNDLVFGAHFLIQQRGAVFVDRHDFEVLRVLSKSQLPFKFKDCPPWVELLPFETYSDFANAFLANIANPKTGGLDVIATCQVPAFDDLSIDSLIEHKKKDSMKTVTSMIEEEWDAIGNAEDFRHHIASKVQDLLWAAYDDVKPTRREVALAIGGGLPLGPINPFSLVSIQENTTRWLSKEHQCLIALNNLRLSTRQNT